MVKHVVEEGLELPEQLQLLHLVVVITWIVHDHAAVSCCHVHDDPVHLSTRFVTILQGHIEKADDVLGRRIL